MSYDNLEGNLDQSILLSVEDLDSTSLIPLNLLEHPNENSIISVNSVDLSFVNQEADDFTSKVISLNKPKTLEDTVYNLLSELDLKYINVQSGEHEKNEESKLESKTILKNHEVTETLRKKMIDWIELVLKMMGFEDSTFELTITLMDLFFLESVKNK